jgi:hypothetical protein
MGGAGAGVLEFAAVRVPTLCGEAVTPFPDVHERQPPISARTGKATRATEDGPLSELIG